MRTPIMAGNWKMNKTVDESVELARAILAGAGQIDGVERIVCPAFVCLPAVQQALQGSTIGVGAQNLHWADSGAYTGEVSGPMLKGLVQYVIVGHSERRQHFDEDDQTIQKKVQSALNHAFVPIVCVGESLEQNENGETHTFVSQQVEVALQGLKPEQVSRIIVAYEPIWAIGTGRAATAAQAQAICGNTVRAAIAATVGDTVANTTRILYGGSTNPGNIAEIMQQPDIDGALIGGASLKASDYCAMVQTTAQLYANR